MTWAKPKKKKKKKKTTLSREKTKESLGNTPKAWPREGSGRKVCEKGREGTGGRQLFRRSFENLKEEGKKGGERRHKAGQETWGESNGPEKELRNRTWGKMARETEETLKTKLIRLDVPGGEREYPARDEDELRIRRIRDALRPRQAFGSSGRTGEVRRHRLMKMAELTPA